MAAPATLVVFNILRAQDGTPLANVTVKCTFGYTAATVTATGDAFVPQTQIATTDPTGRYAFTVVGNDLLSPANTVYGIQEPNRIYEIAPQSINGATQQTTAANVIVNTPTALAAATSNLTGPLTVAGLLTASAGLAVTGNASVSGNLSVSGTFSPSALTVTPGTPGIDTTTAGALWLGKITATSIVLGAATTVSAGLLTASGGLTVVGAVTLPAASIADAALSANVALKNLNNAFSVGQTITGTLGVSAGLTVSAGGAAITGNSTVTGTLTTTAALSVPPSAGAGLPTTSYGTVPVKLDDQSTASAASITLTVPAGALYRILEIDITGRSDQGGAQGVLAQFNADTGANYDYLILSDSNTTLVGNAPTIAGSSGNVGTLCASGATAGAVGNSTVVISNADSATLRKVWRFVANRFDTDAAGSAVVLMGSGQWRNAANPITSIKLLPAAGNLINFRAILYGRP